MFYVTVELTHNQEFKHDFYPGENITAVMDSGERVPGLIREKTKFPELVNFDGTIERKAFARYFLSIDNRKDLLLVDEDHIVRDRKAFTKQRLRSFLKKTVDRELWAGAPWCVKAKFADEYRIDGEIPQHLTYESQLAQRKVNLAMRKGEYGGQILDFFPRLPELKPKGQKAKGVNQDLARLSTEYQRSVSANPDFGKVPQVIQQAQIDQFVNGQNGFAQFNGYHPIAAKGHPKPPPPPPPPKYPIEDLELPPDREGITRPAMKFLSKDIPSIHQIPQPVDDGISMHSVGYLLETWDTLNVYCEVFVLDSFTFDDYVEALQLTSDVFQCDLLVEIHCAVLKQLVNDSNDRNGQIQIPLPELIQSETEDDSAEDRSTTQTVSPEPEVKPSGRTTRSSLAKAEAAELKGSEDHGRLPHPDSRLHRAGEMEQLNKDYDWKSRLRKRDFADGRWVYIIVGLLNQLSGDPRRKRACDEILAKLAPLDQDPSPEVAIARYELININTRVKILQILCMLSLETKAIRAYMEDCNNNMTEYRKEKIDLQKKRRAA